MAKPLYFRKRRLLPAVTAAMAGLSALAIAAQDDPNDFKAGAKPATAPASAPDPAIKPATNPLQGIKPRVPDSAQKGVILLSDGTRLEGKIWSTLDTPYRVWIEENKNYKDIDLAMVKQIEVRVLAETMEEDWRWLKEGSDQKVYSGKKYPRVALAYKFTLTNGQSLEGTVLGLIYLDDAAKTRTLTLYKEYRGTLDETLKDLVYIKSIQLDPAPASTEKKTTKLPLLD